MDSLKALYLLYQTCARLETRLEDLMKDIVRMLMVVLAAKDQRTCDHTIRGSRYALLLGRALKLSEEELVDLEIGALLHDIGKIGIPDSILLKRGPLTPEEYEIMKTHSMLSANILSCIKPFQRLVPIVKYHQERMDGGGYPDSLQGEKIPLLARIVGIADAFDAMTSERPYRKAMTEKMALEELRRNAGTQFDAKLVELFIKEYGRKKYLPHVSAIFPEEIRKKAVGA